MKNTEALVNFPESLRKLPQWILWKYETRDKKITKVPYQINGKKAAVNRPEEWSTMEKCLEVADGYDGVGFVFTDGYIGIDLDKCFDYDGSLKEFAQDVLLTFNSYTEISPSGNGLHIIIESDVQLDGRKKNGIECYATGRFFTVTGNVFNGRDTLRDCDIIAWHKEIFGEKKTEVKTLPESSGYLPDDETILNKMYRAKHGKRNQNLFETGEWEKEKYGSQSEADLALVGSLMFFSKNNQVVVDRLFRRSKLMREKWDELHGGETYGQRTMTMAVSSDVFDWKEPQWEEEEFIMSGGKDPVPLLILENVCRAIASDTEFQSRFRYNDFSHMIEILNGATWDLLQDIDILEAQRYISREYTFFAKISKEMTIDVIRYMASRIRVNPPVDYLKNLSWDNVPRIEFWLHVVFGVPNDELHEKIGSNWLKGLVSRVLFPGCQFDQVLVLEGKQGWRKSTALRKLGSPWHVESTLSTDDRDFYMLLARNMIVEFSEGEIVGRTSARKLKAVITKVEDSFRAPYERGIQTFKRSCVFAMTTNDSDYQKDETGGRRWLPVVLKKSADTAWLKENRDQLYAEAVYRVVELKETTYEYPLEELNALQETKEEDDGYSEDIVDWYGKLPERRKEEGVRPEVAYKEAIDSSRLDIPKEAIWRIRKIFRSVLKLETGTKKVDGIVKRRWFRAE